MPTRRVRDQAIAHNIECIEIGEKLGSKALTGVDRRRTPTSPARPTSPASFERYIDSMKAVYKALPADWSVFIEHKIYEPAFYSTVIQDWGSSYLAATELGPKALCLVDLGHHAPTVNIEMIVARLIQFKKLAGFHFNDSKYGDDDLDTASINPYQLFLVFNELVGAAVRKAKGFEPAYMLDQSHTRHRSDREPDRQRGRGRCAPNTQALIIDREALAGVSGGQRRVDGQPDAEAGLSHRRGADPGQGAGRQGRRHRSGRGLYRASKIPPLRSPGSVRSVKGGGGAASSRRDGPLQRRLHRAS